MLFLIAFLLVLILLVLVKNESWQVTKTGGWTIAVLILSVVFYFIVKGA